MPSLIYRARCVVQKVDAIHNTIYAIRKYYSKKTEIEKRKLKIEKVVFFAYFVPFGMFVDRRERRERIKR